MSPIAQHSHRGQEAHKAAATASKVDQQRRYDNANNRRRIAHHPFQNSITKPFNSNVIIIQDYGIHAIPYSYPILTHPLQKTNPYRNRFRRRLAGEKKRKEARTS